MTIQKMQFTFISRSIYYCSNRWIRIYTFEDDNTATLSSLGLQEGLSDRANNSCKGKILKLMNGLVNSRDVNVIANAFHGTYAILSPKSNKHSNKL